MKKFSAVILLLRDRSLEAQKDVINDYCRKNEISVMGYFTDHDYPKLMTFIQINHKNIDMVIYSGSHDYRWNEVYFYREFQHQLLEYIIYYDIVLIDTDAYIISRQDLDECLEFQRTIVYESNNEEGNYGVDMNISTGRLVPIVYLRDSSDDDFSQKTYHDLTNGVMSYVFENHINYALQIHDRVPQDNLNTKGLSLLRDKIESVKDDYPNAKFLIVTNWNLILTKKYLVRFYGIGVRRILTFFSPIKLNKIFGCEIIMFGGQENPESLIIEPKFFEYKLPEELKSQDVQN